MRIKKKHTNKHQHKLIVLISTLTYINLTFEKYTQRDILYYFNGNLKRNGQKEVKLKTLQNYLYKLEKTLKITMNYYKHLGKNFGTEIYYKLRYSKKECHYRINKYFKNKKEERFESRVNTYYKKNCIKNGSVEKWECSYNIYNNKKEEEKNNESKQSIEELQIKKYAKKCKFKSNGFLSILNLKINKDDKIKLLKTFKKTEAYFESIVKTKKNQSKLEIKKKKLTEILKGIQLKFENEGYNSKYLKIQIQKVYEQYENKPHFIIESHKYNDLNKAIEKLKKSVKFIQNNTEKKDKNIRNNIFSILIEQLKHKAKIEVLIPIIKEYLNEQDKLEYSQVFNNHYYHELLELVENEKYYLKLEKYKKIVT